MRVDWNRAYRWSVLLSSGGVAVGIFQSFALISWSDVVTSFLTLFLTALVRAFRGGDVSSLSA